MSETLTQAINDYMQAKKIVNNPSYTSFHSEALRIIDQAQKTVWSYPCPCIICGTTEPIQATTEVIAGWMSPPKLVCGDCDSKAVLFIEQDKQ